FEEGVYRDFATLRVSPLGMNRLRGFGPIVARAAEQTAGRPDARGWRQVTVPIESVEHAAREMLRLGDDALVLEPAALRDALIASARQMLERYEVAQAPASTKRAPARRKRQRG
ncbi:MAG TPA: WYL domain-containing protein, partial [Burkholderiaceae bacterium]|nr:WYL domain-containing protein [Burkholderiaceae bacterium]